jgi:predicted transcriptional regulator
MMKMAKRSLNELREEMRAVARGEGKPALLPAREVLNVLASSEHMEILQVIHKDQPGTVSELSKLVGRAQPNISRSLQQLAKHGLIKLVREGREVRPLPCVESISISLAKGTYETVPTGVLMRAI